MFTLFKEGLELFRMLSTIKKDPKAIVFYSESDVYFQYYEGYIQYLLEHSELNIYYITSDRNDRVLAKKSERFFPYFLDSLAARAIENLDVRVIVMTVPELNHHFLKRSRFSSHHIHLFHGMGSTHLQFIKGAFDHYDTVFCVGPYHVAELRQAERLYKTKQKVLLECGYWRLEKIYRDFQSKPASGTGPILIAPSWHENNLLDVGLEQMMPWLSSLGTSVVIRPHPEFLKRHPMKIQRIKHLISGTTNISLETTPSSLSLLEANLLITDWSGIAFEYALGVGKSVLFINTPCRVDNPEYLELGIEPVEFEIRNGVLGESIDLNQLSNIRSIVEGIEQNRTSFREKMNQVRQRYVFNWLRSNEIGGEYLKGLYSQTNSTKIAKDWIA